MLYKRPHHYTPEELSAAWKADLLNDAERFKNQAENGPYYPEKGITKESLLDYAAYCRKQAGQEIPNRYEYSKVSPV